MPGGEKTFRNEGWLIRTVKGPIMGDKDLEQYRKALSALVLPEMVFHLNRVELVHEASGTVISFNALDALAGWKEEDLPPLQVRVAKEWRKAREHEIQQQNAVQLTYDWTFTTPYTCTVVPPPSPPPSSSPSSSPATCTTTAAAAAPANSCGVPDFVYGKPTTSTTSTGSHAAATELTTCPNGAAPAAVRQQEEGDGSGGQSPALRWQPTSEQIDRGLLMERDPILFYDELPLYESDLDDNGVCALTAKLRVMPRCWLLLLRLWVRVDGCMVRLREARLFCRHDRADKRLEVLQEVKHCEGDFSELRSRGAPEEGPAWADGDAAAQVFQAVAPLGLRLMQTRKLRLPPAPPSPASPPPAS